jgi:hypothetical protein
MLHSAMLHVLVKFARVLAAAAMCKLLSSVVM